MHTSFCGFGIEIFLCVLNRQCELSEVEIITYFLPLAIAACGAVSGAAMVIGSIFTAADGADSDGKMKNYQLVRDFCDEFRKRHNGTIICREMLKIAAEKKETAKPDERTAEYYGSRPCAKAVYDAAEILESMIEANAE